MIKFLKKLFGIKEKNYLYQITIAYTDSGNAFFYSLELEAKFYSLELEAKDDDEAKNKAIIDFKYYFEGDINEIKIIKAEIDSKMEYDEASKNIH